MTGSSGVPRIDGRYERYRVIFVLVLPVVISLGEANSMRRTTLCGIAAFLLLVVILPENALGQYRGAATPKPLSASQQAAVNTALAGLESAFPNLPGPDVSWPDITVDNIQSDTRMGMVSSEAGRVGVNMSYLESLGVGLPEGIFVVLFHEILHLADGLTSADGCAYHCAHMTNFYRTMDLICECKGNGNATFTPVYCFPSVCLLLCQIVDNFWNPDGTRVNQPWRDCLASGECAAGTPEPFSGNYPAPLCCTDICD